MLNPETTERLLDTPAGIRWMTIHGPGAIQRLPALRTPRTGKAGGRPGSAVRQVSSYPDIWLEIIQNRKWIRYLSL